MRSPGPPSASARLLEDRRFRELQLLSIAGRRPDVLAAERHLASSSAAMRRWRDHRASVLAALQDAEASVSRYGAARIALAPAGDGLQQAPEISRLRRLRRAAGAIANSQALEAGSREIAMHLAEINSRAGLTPAYLAVAKSLGLGRRTELAVGS